MNVGMIRIDNFAKWNKSLLPKFVFLIEMNNHEINK